MAFLDTAMEKGIDSASKVFDLFSISVKPVSDINKEAEKNTLTIYGVVSSNVPPVIKSNIAKMLECKYAVALNNALANSYIKADADVMNNYFSKRFKNSINVFKSDSVSNAVERLIGESAKLIDLKDLGVSMVTLNGKALNETPKTPKPRARSHSRIDDDLAKLQADRISAEISSIKNKTQLGIAHDTAKLNGLTLQNNREAQRTSLDKHESDANIKNTEAGTSRVEAETERIKAAKGLEATESGARTKRVDAETSLTHRQKRTLTIDTMSNARLAKAQTDNTNNKTRLDSARGAREQAEADAIDKSEKLKRDLNKATNSHGKIEQVRDSGREKDYVSSTGTSYTHTINSLDKNNQAQSIKIYFTIKVCLLEIDSAKIIDTLESVKGRDLLFQYMQMRAGSNSVFKGFIVNLKEIDKEVKRNISVDLEDRILSDMTSRSGFLAPRVLGDIYEAKHYTLIVDKVDIEQMDSQFNIDFRSAGNLRRIFDTYKILSFVVIDSVKKDMIIYDSDNPLAGNVISYGKYDKEEDMMRLFSSLTGR